jgi:hypothetical protein
MNHGGRLLARVFVAIFLVGSITACVSPAARVPCDGWLEPINPALKKAHSSNKRTESAKPKASP